VGHRSDKENHPDTAGWKRENFDTLIHSFSVSMGMTGDNNNWKQRLIRFILFVIIGFLCAFLYRYFKR